MIGQGRPDALGRPTGPQKDVDVGMVIGQPVYIPLNFWFCRNVGLALPLIALQYHTVKINVTFAELSDLVRTETTLGTSRLTGVKLWLDYIYLDVEERKKFSQTAHEYLIEQVQFNGGQLCEANMSRYDTTTQRVNLNFNHPVKELVWVAQPVNYLTGNNRQPSNYTAIIGQAPANQTDDLIDSLTSLSVITLMNDIKQLNQSSIKPPGALNPVISAKLTLNGHDRFTTQTGDYFKSLKSNALSYQHSNIPWYKCLLFRCKTRRYSTLRLL